MTVIYGQYFEEIGPFTDTKYILVKLEKVCRLILISICISNDVCYMYLGWIYALKENIKIFILH